VKTRSALAAVVLMAVLSLLGLACESGPVTEGASSLRSVTAPLGRARRARPRPPSGATVRDVEVEMRVPKEVAFTELAVVGEDISLGRGARVRSRDGFAILAGVGRGQTKLAERASRDAS